MNTPKKYVEEIPNKKTAMRLKDALNDIKTGNVSPSFDTAKEAAKWLENQIKNAHRIRKEIRKKNSEIAKKNTKRILQKTGITHNKQIKSLTKQA